MEPTTTTLPAIMRTEEAAAYLGHSPATLKNWRMLGTGPDYVKAASRVLYRLADLNLWCAERIVHPGR